MTKLAKATLARTQIRFVDANLQPQDYSDSVGGNANALRNQMRGMTDEFIEVVGNLSEDTVQNLAILDAEKR